MISSVVHVLKPNNSMMGTPTTPPDPHRPPSEQYDVHPLTAIANIKSPVFLNYWLLRLIVAIMPRNALYNLNIIHFARFLFFSPKKSWFPTQFGVLTAYDGGFKAYMEDFMFQSLDIFDYVLPFIEGADDLYPIHKNPDAFISWLWKQNQYSEFWYSAYPTMNVPTIRTAPDGLINENQRDPKQNPFTLIATIAEPIQENYEQLKAISKVLNNADFGDDSKLHYARMFFLSPTNTEPPIQVGVATTFDGSIEEYLGAAVRIPNNIFERILPFVKDAKELMPYRDNEKKLLKWLNKKNLKPRHWYSAYPALSALAVRAFAKPDRE